MQQTEPHVERLAGNFKLTWYSRNLRISVSRIEERYGKTTGEFHVEHCSDDGDEDVLRFEKYDLTGNDDKRRLVKKLAERFGNDEYQWQTIVEQCFVIVMEQYREGDPLITITGDRKEKKFKFRSNPLILELEPNVFFADGGSGKSIVALLIAVMMDTPPPPPLPNIRWDTEPGAVLILDWETDDDEVENRVSAIKAGLNIPSDIPTSIHYIRMTQPLEHEIYRIQQTVLDEDIDLVIVDSMEMAISGNSNEAQPIKNLYAALRTLGTTSLLIDHLNKEGGWVGNAYKRNFARNAWRMQSTQIPGTDNITIGFFHEKHNNTRKIPAFAIEVDFTLDDTGEMQSVTFRKGDIAAIEELDVKRTLNERIRELLKPGRQTVSELTELLGLNKEDENKVRSTLNKGLGKVFVKIDIHWWGNLQGR